MLHGIYHRLTAGSLLISMLPASMQPRIIKFKRRYQPPLLKLMLKERVIGYYDVWKNIWVINRPWRLIIDETKLPVITESSIEKLTDLRDTPT